MAKKLSDVEKAWREYEQAQLAAWKAGQAFRVCYARKEAAFEKYKQLNTE